MGKKRTTWVLDTETKGTGAEMVPLERLLERKRLKGDRDRIRVIGPQAEPSETPVTDTDDDGDRGPRKFRIVDVRSRHALADGANLSEALEVLSEVGSIVDVNVYVQEPGESRWRPLSMSERRALWRFREPLEPAR
jgi:hypothetical protein